MIKISSVDNSALCWIIFQILQPANPTTNKTLHKLREHLQIIIGNLVSDVNIGMFRFRYLLHATQEFPIKSRLNRKSIGSISIHIGTRRVIGTSSIPTRGIYTISLSLLFIVCSRLKLACPAKKKIIIITGCEQTH